MSCATLHNLLPHNFLGLNCSCLFLVALLIHSELRGEPVKGSRTYEVTTRTSESWSFNPRGGKDEGLLDFVEVRCGENFDEGEVFHKLHYCLQPPIYAASLSLTSMRKGVSDFQVPHLPSPKL